MAITPPTLASALLPVVDTVRGIPGILGFHGTTVTARLVTWLGTRPGVGECTIVDTPLLVMSNTQNPRVRQLSDKDALASGGIYTNQDIRVGPVTPPFEANEFVAEGGVEHATIDPPMIAAGTGAKQIFFKLAGRGFQFPVWFVRVGDETVPPLRRFLTLRRAGNQLPGGVP
jgi:hypothetical protein